MAEQQEGTVAVQIEESEPRAGVQMAQLDLSAFDQPIARKPAPVSPPAPAQATPPATLSAFDAPLPHATQAVLNPYDVQDWRQLTPAQARERLQAIPAYDQEKRAAYDALPWSQQLITAPPPGLHPNVREATLNHLQDIALRDEPQGQLDDPHWLLDPPQILANMYPQAALMGLGVASKALGKGVRAGVAQVAESAPAQTVTNWLRPYGDAARTITQALAETPAGQYASRWVGKAGDMLTNARQATMPTFLSPEAKEASYPIRHYSAESRTQGLRNSVQLREGLTQAETKLREMQEAWHDAWVARYGTEPAETVFAPRPSQGGGTPAPAPPPPVSPLWEGGFKYGYIPAPDIPEAEMASWIDYAISQGYQPAGYYRMVIERQPSPRSPYGMLLATRQQLRALRHTMPDVPSAAQLSQERGLVQSLNQLETKMAEDAYEYMMHRRPLDPRLQDYIPAQHKPLPFEIEERDPFLEPPGSGGRPHWPQEQPPRAGMLRLYRGESTRPRLAPDAWLAEHPDYRGHPLQRELQGRWWTSDLDEARAHAGDQRRLFFLDVPQDQAQHWTMASQPPAIQEFSGSGNEYLVPRDLLQHMLPYYEQLPASPPIRPPLAPPLSASTSATEPLWLTRQDAEQALTLAQQRGFTASQELQDAMVVHQEAMDAAWQSMTQTGGPESGAEHRILHLMREEDQLTREMGEDALTWLLDHQPPPPAPGMKRLYRGQVRPEVVAQRKPVADWIQQSEHYQEQLKAQGRWWTDDPAIAQWYVKESEPHGHMVYLDVPESVATQAHLPKQPREIQRFSKDVAQEYFLPQSYQGQGQDYHDVPLSLLQQHPYGRAMRGEALRAHQPGYQGTPYPSATNAARHFYDSMEHGLNKYSPELEQQLQAKLQEAYAQLHQLPRAVQEDYLWNHWPTMWQDQGKAERILEEMTENTHIPRTYRDRVMTSNVETMQLGLAPKRLNPVEHVLGQLRVLDGFLMYHKALQAQHQLGLVRYVPHGEVIPEGWQALPARVAESLTYVPGKRAVAEAGAGLEPVGHWYAPEDVAKIWENWSGKGLRESAAYDWIRSRSNAMVQLRLSVSAFHATAISLYAMASEWSLGLMQLSEGRGLQGIQSMGRALTPYAAKQAFTQGRQLMQEAMFPGSMPPEIAEMVAHLTKGGMDFQRSAFHSGAPTAAGNMWRQMEGHPFLRLVEKISEPLMGKFVPAVKLGAAMRLAEEELARLGAGATEQQIRAAMARVVNSIDNRFGLLAYDNLFWNRTLKDLAHVMVQSPGWNLGWLREGAGGVFDMGRALSGTDPQLSSRTAFVVALPFVVGLYGGMMHYMMTGKRPEDLRDYYYPQTGTARGKYQERVKLPSYIHDIAQMTHSLAGKSDLIGWAEGKLNPLLVTTYELAHNADYFGLPIRGAHGVKTPMIDRVLEGVPGEIAPALRSFWQTITTLADAYLPYSVGQVGRASQHGDTLETVLGALGISTAPSWIKESAGQRLRREWVEGRRQDQQRQRLENR